MAIPKPSNPQEPSTSTLPPWATPRSGSADQLAVMAAQQTSSPERAGMNDWNRQRKQLAIGESPELDFDVPPEPEVLSEREWARKNYPELSKQKTLWSWEHEQLEAGYQRYVRNQTAMGEMQLRRFSATMRLSEMKARMSGYGQPKTMEAAYLQTTDPAEQQRLIEAHGKFSGGTAAPKTFEQAYLQESDPKARKQLVKGNRKFNRSGGKGDKTPSSLRELITKLAAKGKPTDDLVGLLGRMAAAEKPGGGAPAGMEGLAARTLSETKGDSLTLRDIGKAKRKLQPRRAKPDAARGLYKGSGETGKTAVGDVATSFGEALQAGPEGILEALRIIREELATHGKAKVKEAKRVLKERRPTPEELHALFVAGKLTKDQVNQILLAPELFDEKERAAIIEKYRAEATRASRAPRTYRPDLDHLSEMNLGMPGDRF